ncbi:ammonium transporter [Thalassospiraceae bacterium LMO-SO8]|nr:ammonium transporter [Alphaproteobacteria bacterium LMO-S08]WND75283.1 ammonium transporter [Thalassospiraceae bacterium LMO-SO8]
MSKFLHRQAAPVFALVAVLLTIFTPDAAFAADQLNSGDTAWIITATALVLFMTLPGLALFYGGLVRSRNVLSVLMHCVAIACLMSVLWLIIGYSLSFTDGAGANQLVGGLSRMFLAGVGTEALSGTIPENVFFAFQMTFAIITPALMVGAYVERIKFSAVLILSALWLIVVYAPVTHWVWGGGWLAQMGVMDFAGGLVVHATAGISSLVIVKALGARHGFPNEVSPPHNPGMVAMGACMLWVGWFGFNGGSALAANGAAGMALTVTHIAAATASLVWMLIEWKKYGKPSLVGLVTGTIAGLATITPASGFVGPIGALIIGVAAGLVCFKMVQIVKTAWKLDDSLDVFAVHGVGGSLGTILVAFLCAPMFGGLGLPEGKTMVDALGVQALGLAATVAWSAVATFILVKITAGLTGGIRVREDDELEGLDITNHGETAYRLD